MNLHNHTKGGIGIKKNLVIAAFSLFLLILSPVYGNAEASSIQQQIEEARPGETIELSEGEYEESFVINKPVHLVGTEDVTLIQKGSSPGITIQSNDVVIENMNINYLNDDNDSPAILINGDHNSLNNLHINTNSYGIQLDGANYNTISDVSIKGDKDKSLTDREHGIDLWESHYNEIYDTRLQYVNDGIYIERSNENKVSRNIISHSRYGSHLMFTKNVVLEENESFENVSGMYIMGSEG